MQVKKRDRIALLVAGTIAAGTVLRLWGIGFGLPMTFCGPDEARVIQLVWGFGRGDLNPHLFHYPTFYLYILFALSSLYYAFGRTTGMFTRTDFIASYTLDPSPLYLIGRGFTALTGILTIYLVYELGRRAYSRSAGVLAAAFTAFAFLHVRDSHLAKMDITLVFWIVLAYLFILRVAGEGRRSDAILAGLFVGLAASTKYNAFLMAIPLTLSHLLGLRDRRTTWKALLPDLCLSGLAALLAFLATSPFTLLDFNAFIRDFRYDIVAIRGAQAQFAYLGPGWVHHARFTLPYSLGLPLYGLSLAGLLCALWRRRTPDLLLLSFCLPYYAVAGSGWLVFTRYLLPILPILCLFGARVLEEGAARLRPGRGPVIAGGMAFLCILDPAYRAIRCDQILSQRDTRLLAAEWVAAHIPSGTKVALGGSVWARPNLLESPEVLEDRLRAIRQAGGGGDAIQTLLTSPRYRARPSYFVVAINDSISPLWGGGPAIPDRHIDRLLTERVDYLVVSTHPHLKHYGTLEPGLADFLKRHPMTPLAAFSPTDGQEGGPPPVFDPIDAFFVPLARFGDTVRPGPYIHIYRLSP